MALLNGYKKIFTFAINLFVKVFLYVVDENAGDAMIIVLWSSGSTHHLKNISDGHIDVATGLAIIVFRPFDDY